MKEPFLNIGLSSLDKQVDFWKKFTSDLTLHLNINSN